MSLADWAEKWISSFPWMHRLRVLQEFDQEKIDWHMDNCTLEDLAMLWKSYLADSQFAVEEEPNIELPPFGNRPGL